MKSRDPQTGREEARTVTASVKRQARAVVTVSVSDAKTGKSEALTCTPEHPFFAVGRGWVEAGSLGVGASLVSRAGPALTVQAVAWHRAQGGDAGPSDDKTSSPTPYTVYNLTVEGDHTFFVGTTGGGTWVHNACYTEASDAHVNESWHSAESPYQEGQSKFYPGEGGQEFTDEVVNHPEVDSFIQDDGRINHTVDDLGRFVGRNKANLPTRGGRVIVEGDPPFDPAAAPGDVVTQYPFSY